MCREVGGGFEVKEREKVEAAYRRYCTGDICKPQGRPRRALETMVARLLDCGKKVAGDHDRVAFKGRSNIMSWLKTTVRRK